MDVMGGEIDLSADPRFRRGQPAAVARPYYSPVYFRKESEPYMTIAMAVAGRDAGVTVAELNLKFIWDVVSQIKVGKAGQAYVVDGPGTSWPTPTSASSSRRATSRGSPRCERPSPRRGPRRASASRSPRTRRAGRC